MRFRSLIIGQFILAILSFTAMAQVDTTRQQPAKPQLPSQPGAPASPLPGREPVIVAPAPVQKPVAPGEVLSETKTAKAADDRSFLERLAYGGGLGLGFSNGGGYFSLSPFVAYKFTSNDRFLIGPGITYQRSWYGDLSVSDYGGRVIARYLVFPKFFGHAEVESLSKQIPYRVGNTNQIITRRYLINSTLVGLGYRSQLGELSSFDFMVLYNTTPDSRDPETGSIRIKAGITLNWAAFSW